MIHQPLFTAMKWTKEFNQTYSGHGIFLFLIKLAFYPRPSLFPRPLLSKKSSSHRR